MVTKSAVTEAEFEDLPTAEDEEALKRLEILNGLARSIENKFEQRANDRLTKEGEWSTSRMLYNAPLSDGDNYYSDNPFKPQPGRRKRPTPNIVRTKCDTAVANSVSMQFAADEQNWNLFPPANVTDQAVTEACRLMEKEIKAQLDACNYGIQARLAMEDRVILGTGVLKGPVNTGKIRTKYVKEGDTWVTRVVQDHTPAVEHVPLWRFYPDLDVATFTEGLDAIQLHPKTALELALYRNHPGFDSEAINAILDRDNGYKPESYNEQFLNRIKAPVWASPYMYKDRYAVLEYHGPVTYDEVCKLGVEPTYASPTYEYYAEVWVCCGRIIRLELENIEGQYETPYSVAVWKRDPTSPFGFGHPLLLADSQRVITECYHMILDNASLTSGPQYAMLQQYIQPIDGDYTLSPNKGWLLTDPQYDVDKAIQFFTPTNVISNIMPVLELARQFADEESATTSFAAGLGSPNNVDSATGQLVMMNNSTTLLDFLAEEWDDQVTEKVVRRFYAWNMQYSTKEEIKGDYVVDVRSSSEYKNKQMHIRDLERLAMESQQNPQTALHINADELTKARLQLMNLPNNKIVKNADEVKAAQDQMDQRPDPAMIELQMRQQEQARLDAELELKREQLQFEQTRQHQQEQWEYQEKMGSNQARAMEAQAQVIKARAEYDTEMLKLAAKDRHLAMQLQANTVLKENDTQAKVFMKSMEETRKARELENVQKELTLKEKLGSGI